MLKRREQLLAQLILVCDAVAIGTSYLVAYRVRNGLLAPYYGQLNPLPDYAWLVWIIGPAWVLSLWKFGLYQSAAYESWLYLGKLLLKSQITAGLTLLGSMYLTKREDVSRLFLQSFLLISAVLLAGEKACVLLALSLKTGRISKSKRSRVLLVGDQRQAEPYLRLLQTHPHWSIEIAAQIALQPANAESAALGTDEWSQVLGGYVVDEVVTVSPDVRGFERLAAACAARGLVFRMMVKLPPAKVGNYLVEDAGHGFYFVSLETVPQDFLPLLAKRGLDVAGALAGLMICGLVYPLHALWLRRHSPGPVLFRQPRLGQNGRRFMLYKFRTMRVDAEQRLPALLGRNQMQGSIFKLDDDPRIISGGRFMRRTHLDELPQFWNVLKGEMSLVGTRPPTPCEAERYSDYHYRRLSMKPGITGLWQLNGNGAIRDFEDIVKLDCSYIDNWSLGRDLGILARTCLKVARGNGW